MTPADQGIYPELSGGKTVSKRFNILVSEVALAMSMVYMRVLTMDPPFSGYSSIGSAIQRSWVHVTQCFDIRLYNAKVTHRYRVSVQIGMCNHGVFINGR